MLCMQVIAKWHWGATPPNPCKINGCSKLIPAFTPSVDSANTYKLVLQLSVFYSCNKQLLMDHEDGSYQIYDPTEQSGDDYDRVIWDGVARTAEMTYNSISEDY